MGGIKEKEIIDAVVVARFSPQKRNIEILYYLHELLRQGGKINITFIGDGPLLEKAKYTAKKLSLDDNVIFLGAKKM